MTENKRFRMTETELIFMVLDNEKALSRKEIVDKLNQLYEENEQLKKDCTALISHNQEYRKENELLKQQLEDCRFALRTELAHQRVEKEEHSDSVYSFKKKIEKW